MRDALLLLLCVCMRVTYMSSRGGSAVAPGGSGASTRWPTVTPGPAAAAGSTVVRSRSRLRWRLRLPAFFEIARDFYVCNGHVLATQSVALWSGHYVRGVERKKPHAAVFSSSPIKPSSIVSAERWIRVSLEAARAAVKNKG